MKHVIITVFSVLLVAVSAVLPAFAADPGWLSYSRNLSSFDTVDKLYWSLQSGDYFSSTSHGSLRFNTFNDAYSSLCLKFPISAPVQSGESLRLSFSGSGYSHSSISYVTVYFVDTQNVSTSPIISTIYRVFPVTQSSNGSFTFSIDYLYTADSQYNFDNVFFEFTVTKKVSGGYFQINDGPVFVGYGDSSSPNVPSYSSPNMSGFDEYNGLDQSVQNGAQPGIDSGASLLSKFPQYLENFRGGLLLLTNMFVALVPSEVITVLSISVMLGIVGTLFGLGSVAFYNAHMKPDSDIKRRDRVSKIRQANKDIKEMGQ